MSNAVIESFRLLRASALAEPAFVHTPSGWLEDLPRRWLAWGCAHLRELVGAIVGAPVALAPVNARGSAALEPAFSISLRLGGQPLVITLDLTSARALVDTITAGLGGLRGAGPLSDGEEGVLEFVLLEAAERLIRRLDAPPGTLCVRAFGSHATGAPPGIGPASTGCIELEMCLGASRGVILVSGVQAAALAQEPSVPTREAAPNAVVTLGLALDAVPMHAGELAAIEPGDCLMLASQSPDQWWRVAHVVTETGWSLGQADEVALRPALVSARLMDFDPRPFAPLSPGCSTLVLPVIGAASASTASLARLAPSAIMDFEVDPAVPVRLWAAGAHVGTGELVKADGQGAVRVLSWNRSDHHA